jgi:hypothetical protein
MVIKNVFVKCAQSPAKLCDLNRVKSVFELQGSIISAKPIHPFTAKEIIDQGWEFLEFQG